VGEEGLPKIYFLECCEDTIRTLPTLPHDEHDPEDVDTDAEDHAGDETRYAVMSRPYQPRVDSPKSDITETQTPEDVTFGHLKQKHLDKMRIQREEMAL
jgi:hypothetical protein